MSETPVILRELEPSDWESVRRIHDEGRQQELTLCGIDQRAFESLKPRRERVLTSPGLVACAGGELVGFITWWTDGYITLLYVDRVHQGRGIGRRLLEAAIVRIGPEAWTTAIESNTPAVRLYERVGMRVVWSRPRECNGQPYQSVRLALPTSRMRDPAAVRFPGAES